MSLLPSPGPSPDGRFVAPPQATWTDTITRPSRNLGTTPSCCTWTTAVGKALEAIPAQGWGENPGLAKMLPAER